MKGKKVIPSIYCIYDAGGISGVKVSTLGGKKVLVTFLNLEDVKLLLEDPPSMEKWVTKPFVLSRMVWEQCFGIPLRWRVDIF